jgi:hypothetical protein
VEREKKTQTLAMKVQASLLDRLNDIAEHEDRPIGYVARELMVRGLGLYEQDGRLRGSQAANSSEKAPIVARIDHAVPSRTQDEREAIRMELEDQLQPERRRKAS